MKTDEDRASAAKQKKKPAKETWRAFIFDVLGFS